jgi:hypothetical protein
VHAELLLDDRRGQADLAPDDDGPGRETPFDQELLDRVGDAEVFAADQVADRGARYTRRGGLLDAVSGRDDR